MTPILRNSDTRLRSSELDRGQPHLLGCTHSDLPRGTPTPSLPLSLVNQHPPAVRSSIPGKSAPLIDPGVFRNVTTIRRLVDEAAELSVRASSGLSSTSLGSMRNGGGNGSWAAAHVLGLDGQGSMGSGRNATMSAIRIHRLRVLSVQKLAAAYKADEIATSVIVMQGGSVFDDIAERVLRHGMAGLILCRVVRHK